MEQMARSTHSMAEGATGGSGEDKSAQNFSRKFLVGVGRGAEVCRPRQLGNDAGPDEPQRDSWVRKWERGKGSRVPRGRVMGKRDLQDQWWVSSIRTTFRDPRAIAASDKITGDE